MLRGYLLANVWLVGIGQAEQLGPYLLARHKMQHNRAVLGPLSGASLASKTKIWSNIDCTGLCDRRLILMRHAESAECPGPDHDRPLSDEGRDSARQVLLRSLQRMLVFSLPC